MKESACLFVIDCLINRDQDVLQTLMLEMLTEEEERSH